MNLYSDETIQDIKNFFSDNTLDILGNYYIYNGSFSTPPCDELVTYIVKEKAIKVSEV
jgi:carbonic anhydrase